jgi:lipopolysaccharide/colanic/teichoic acid biosynthesis glycosyltransferase
MGIELAGPEEAEGESGRYLHRGWLGLVRKRLFDLIVAGAGLVLAAPLFLAIAIAIKRDTKGPVFFRQVRVGRHRRPFRMWKFRKMPHGLRVQGPMLTARDDHRLTRVGFWLERTKLDELPQLLNVLAGHMSVVGPRPEVPKFVDCASPQLWDHVLSVKPGIFGPNQIRFRNEADLYPPDCADLEDFYVRHILPEKLLVDAHYAQQSGWFGDLSLLLRGLLTSLFDVAPRR